MRNHAHVVVGKWLALPAVVKWAAPVAVMTAVWWSSSRSPKPAPYDPVWAFVHNGMHVVAWSVLAAATWCAMRSPRGDNRRIAMQAAAALAVAYGVVDEFHQSAVAGRVASVSDVLTDAAGTWLGLMLMRATFDRQAYLPAHWFGVLLVCVACVALATFGPW